jgi:hypothetical protein
MSKIYEWTTERLVGLRECLSARYPARAFECGLEYHHLRAIPFINHAYPETMVLLVNCRLGAGCGELRLLITRRIPSASLEKTVWTGASYNFV